MEKVSIGNIIGEHGLFIDGDWVESKDQDPNGEVRLIQLADIGDGEFLDKSNRYLTLKKAKELKCTFLKTGDVLIARMPDPLGRACIFPELDYSCVTVVDVCIVRPDSKKTNNVWLKLFINSSGFRQEINKYLTGTTRKRISRGNLARIKFDLPSPDDQQRIANLLSKAEALIKQREDSIALADDLLKYKFLEKFVFSKEVDFQPYLINDLKSGGNETFSNGPFGSDLLSSELTDKGVPVIYIRDIKGGYFIWKSNVFVTKEKAESLPSCQVIAEDIIIAKVGDPPGETTIYPKGSGLAIMTQDVIRIRLDKSKCTPTFFKFYMNSELGKRLIQQIKIKGTRSRFSLGDFKKSTIEIPPISLQEQFTLIVDQIEKLKKYYKQSLDELKQLFSSLSQRAFKGEIDVSRVPLAGTFDLIEGTEEEKTLSKHEETGKKKDITDMTLDEYYNIPEDIQDEYGSIEEREYDKEFFFKKNFIGKSFNMQDIEELFNRIYYDKGWYFKYEEWKEFIFAEMKKKNSYIRQRFNEISQKMELYINETDKA